MLPMNPKDYDKNYDWQSTFFSYDKALSLTVLFIRLRLNGIEGRGAGKKCTYIALQDKDILLWKGSQKEKHLKNAWKGNWQLLWPKIGRAHV